MNINKDRGSYCVYRHKNLTNNKAYIGITRLKVERRWRNGKGYRSNVYFTRAIEKYEWNGFSHEILYKGLLKEDAEKIEVELIKQYNLTDYRFGYNLDKGGSGSNRVTEETRQKQSKAQIRRNVKGDRNPNFGNKLSEEAKKRISQANKGNKGMIGEENPMYGKTGGLHHCSKNVICLSDSKVFSSIKECAAYYGISKSTLAQYLRIEEKSLPKSFNGLDFCYV